MSRVFTLTFTVSDEEVANFLARAAGDPTNGTPDGQPRNVKTTITDTGVSEDDGPVNTNAPAVDKNGVPWSAEHHASSKAMNADGTWRRIRGGDKATIDAYEAQFKVAATPAAAPVVAETAAPAVGLPGAAAAPAIGLPGMPGVETPVPVPPVSYDDLMARFNAVHAVRPSIVAETPAIYTELNIVPTDLPTNETMRRALFDRLGTFL